MTPRNKSAKHPALAIVVFWLWISVSGFCGGISPAKLEINLGPLPIDLYSTAQDFSVLNRHYNAATLQWEPIIPSCATCWGVRACVRGMFNDNPLSLPYNPFGNPNYKGQSVTGVRFFYDLGGGAYSTPFVVDGSGNYVGLSPTWKANLATFFADLHNWGIQRVTPTPVLHAPFSVPPNLPCPSSGFPCRDQQTVTCNGQSRMLRLYRWLPFGIDLTSPSEPSYNLPDNTATAANDSYNCANGNTNFWGWQPLFELITYVRDTAAANQLTIADYDIDNEIDLVNFTVLGRLIYDNAHTTDVLTQIRSIFTASKVTYSTFMARPSQAGFDCPSPGSPYGDSGMLLFESALMSALNGTSFGIPGGGHQHALLCGSGGLTPALLPASYTEPPVTNIHSHVCVEEESSDQSPTGICKPDDATTTATAFYNGVAAFLQRVPARLNNYVVFGETNHTLNRHLLPGPYGPPGCEVLTYVQQASQNVSGFVQSNLNSNRSNIVFRVWNNEIDAPRCFVRPNVPNNVKATYDPTVP